MRKRLLSIYKDIGNKIRRERKKQGLTQEKLAERCSLTRTSLTLIESGKQKLPIDRLYMFAQALKVPVANFLEEYDQYDMISEESKITTTTQINANDMKKIDNIINKKEHL